MTFASTTANDNEILAHFSLQIFKRARELQKQRTGLMSDNDAMSKASLEVFEKAVSDIRNVITYNRLFSLENATEVIQNVIPNILNQAMGKNIANNISDTKQEDDSKKEEEEVVRTLVRETEIVAP